MIKSIKNILFVETVKLQYNTILYFSHTLLLLGL